MYDPYNNTRLDAHQPYPNSYWAHGIDAPKRPHLETHINADVAIIGAGYSGLSCALHLAQHHQAKVVILEANQVGWGCSGRNAGFVLPGTGRLSAAQIQQKWGLARSQAIYREYHNAIDLIAKLIAQSGDCQQTRAGYLKLAHNSKSADDLKHLSDRLNQQYAEKSQFVNPHQIADYLPTTRFYAGLYYPEYFAINPLKFSLNLANFVEQQGIDIYCNSPVQGWERTGKHHQLITPCGRVEAKKVVIASNAYSPKGFSSLTKNRYFPVMSSIVVTEPIPDAQLAQHPIKTGIMAMDSRPMKYYYRLLPDNRLLFGGRGAIAGKNADKLCFQQHLINALGDTLPPLSELKAEHFWSGWVNVSFDDYPRIFVDSKQDTAYLGGYCGSGVSFSVQAGKRLAQLIMGEHTLPDLPFWQTPLPRYPLAFLRRPALAAMYAWQAAKQKLT